MKLKELVEQYGEYTVPQEFIEKLEKPKPKTVWDLKDNDEYYYINADGYIDISTYAEVESEENCVNVGNVFLTKEEAEKEVERRKVDTLLLKYGGRRWYRTNGYNYYIWLNAWNSLVISSTGCVQDTIYFDAEEQARQAVSEIGEERIKKALFEVR